MSVKYLNPPYSRPRPRTGRDALKRIAESWKRQVIGRDVWVQLGASGSFGWYKMKAVDAAIGHGRIMVKVVPIAEARDHWDWTPDWERERAREEAVLSGGLREGMGPDPGAVYARSGDGELPGIWVYNVVLPESEELDK